MAESACFPCITMWWSKISLTNNIHWVNIVLRNFVGLIYGGYHLLNGWLLACLFDTFVLSLGERISAYLYMAIWKKYGPCIVLEFSDGELEFDSTFRPIVYVVFLGYYKFLKLTSSCFTAYGLEKIMHLEHLGNFH